MENVTASVGSHSAAACDVIEEEKNKETAKLKKKIVYVQIYCLWLYRQIHWICRLLVQIYELMGVDTEKEGALVARKVEAVFQVITLGNY